MKLIVGLGNPGKDYSGTRHNIGFAVIDEMSREYSIDVNKGKFKGVLGEGRIGGQKVLLLKPLTYMNLSGESVREVCDFYKIPVEDIIIIYDDISLPVGGLRIREKGSAGGHNGVKSIIAHLKTDEFARIKIGVGSKPDGGDLVNHVLGRFSKDDSAVIDDAVKRGAKAAAAIVATGAKEAMNEFNFVPKDEKSREVQ
ncbi:aminoacyl-tRNA hydrolase [Lachnospiraceae bacterium NSJ-143]|nr:aminoacyl-tRNA hydrolase [Lachnospiraceae bacterium NSJ-143]